MHKAEQMAAQVQKLADEVSKTLPQEVKELEQLKGVAAQLRERLLKISELNKNFVQAVADMRHAQRQYFAAYKNPNPEIRRTWLKESKGLEGRVDKAIKELTAEVTQETLFP